MYVHSPNYTRFDLLWICSATCRTTTPTSCRLEHVHNKSKACNKPTTSSRCCTACFTTCCPQLIELVEFELMHRPIRRVVVAVYTASTSRRGGLRSSTTSDLVTPRCRLSTYGTRAFSVAGPVCWNTLPDYLKSPDISFDCFRQQLQIFLFCRY